MKFYHRMILIQLKSLTHSEKNRPRHFLTMRVQTFAQPNNIGFKIVMIPLVKTFIPEAPPGRNVIKYHKSANSCNPLAVNTVIYPLTPPVLKV